MKKIALVILSALLFTMCSTSKTVKTAAKPEVQYKDDFRSASDKEKTALLKKLKATGAGYSVLIFTKNFKGEKVTASNSNKTVYSGYPFSNLKTGVADQVRIDNTVDTKIYDSFTKKEAVITAKEAQKHKFIYLMKDPSAENPFLITYSNTLRPLE
ncbi:hypothetical protein AMR72_12140 [Flavobacterium psychrophilum]|nr:hypothetical protein AMR72_12140 [Flavobacterium psychrophilum]AOE53203.1 hypothetical protein ALW18_12130 [Flavobacterium psychrophilum]